MAWSLSQFDWNDLIGQGQSRYRYGPFRFQPEFHSKKSDWLRRAKDPRSKCSINRDINQPMKKNNRHMKIIS